MKKTINLMLLALLTMGLGMNFVSCKEEMSEEEKAWHEADPYEKGSEEALDFWTVISQLTDLQTLPDDWKTATFEPTIGKASEADPYTRVVVVADAAEAVAAYSSLIGLSESLPDYTTGNNFSDNRVGKLNYALSRDGQSVATVEVKIKQMPKLKKIVYQTPEQAGENASITGSAYYHFGDVISRVRPEDGVKEYWICVNPASHLTGKTVSHWISVSDLPDKNVYTWTRSDGEDVVLPTAICTQYTYIHDFAEMLYAILNPQKYFSNIGHNSKLGTFSGFKTSNFGYINPYYFQRVQRAWQNLNLFDVVLYRDSIELRKSTELNVFCKGYSWVMGKTGTVYTYTYSGSNWKTATWTKRTYDFKDTSKVPFNIHYWGLTGEGTSSWDPRYAYVVRYATGEALCKLAGSGYSYQTAISGCDPVYVYNQYWYNGGYDLNTKPEVLDANSFKPKSKSLDDVSAEDRGKFVGQDGMIYASKADAERANTKVVAMIVDTYNTNYEIVGDTHGKDKSWYENWVGCIKKGIAIALEDGNLSGESYDPFDYNNTAPKADKEITEVKTYDPTWNKNHAVKATNARWFVPNCYHWQRMLLPYGRTKMYLQTYIHDNLEEMTDTGEYDIDEGVAFVRDVAKAGNAFKNSTQYVVAGYWTTYQNEQRVYSIMLGESICYWVNSANPEAIRYVLTW